ncbi:MAG TPA: phosphate acyltransferase [Acidobacteriota bacterium]|nr:phosphate acyltransferase [Acidobacteriota bacterium]
MIRKEDSLSYHAGERPGKVELRVTKPCLTPRDLRLAYLPGASFPAAEIAADASRAFTYTARGNLVGIITNGSAVPGLGNVGPLAAKPMQEGMALLFKKLADIDVFDIELNGSDPEQILHTVAMLEPTFGGINLKDISAPEGMYIYDWLKDSLEIPVFHENLYSSAVVAAAALLNGLALAEKRIDEIRLVICGAGVVGTGCARLLLKLGVRPENLLMYDKEGLLHPDREDLYSYQRPYTREHTARQLEDGVKGADVFLGASAAGVLTQEMIRSMSSYPIVFALATPEPEITYDAARSCRRDVIVATALGQYPNAVLDFLSFPYIWRGALDVQATRITEGMLIAAAHALAELAREDVVEEVERAYGRQRFSFGPEYLLPKPIDPRILVRESSAVAQAAIAEGVARRPIAREQHEESLVIRLGTGRETMRNLILRARQNPPSVVFSEGSSATVLRACGILIEERIASPVLLGNEGEINAAIQSLNLDPGGITIVDPERSPRRQAYVEEYFRLCRRKGIMRATAEERLTKRDYFAAMMLKGGDVDMMIAGVGTHYSESLRTILEVIGPAPDVRRIVSLYMVLLPKRVYFLADCTVNIDPNSEELAETAILAAQAARSLGFEPRIAMLSFSNFGSIAHPSARKVRQATEIVKEREPGLTIDGEMQLAIAVNSDIRREYFSWSDLEEDANVLVFPDLQSGNIALHLLQHVSEAVAVGPLLMGTDLPAHLLQYGATVEDVVNLATIGAVETAADRHATRDGGQAAT